MPKAFDPEKDIPELDGKTILVTGGNAGLGACTVRALAAHNPTCIYICARTLSKAETLISEIQEQHPKANLKTLQLDLCSFESINKCAEEFKKSSDRLDLLYLNAGIGGMAPGMTNEGYEIHFGSMHIGHALLTQLLMPTMLKTVKESRSSPDVRIVVISSVGAHRHAPAGGLVLKEAKTNMQSHAVMSRYSHAKLANILFARKLAQLYPSITSVSLHPGVVKTEIFEKADGFGWLGWVMGPFLWAVGVTSEEGAKTQLWCGTADGVKSGEYYVPTGEWDAGSKNSRSDELRDQLWEWTDKELAEHGAPGWPSS